MTDYSIQTGRLLLECESVGIASKYGNPREELNSEDREIFIISDLHLAEKSSDNRITQADISYTDLSLIRFLEFTRHSTLSKSAILIINGDFIDFLRIIDTPYKDEDFLEWQKILGRLGIDKPLNDLKDSISNREYRYGLNTNDYKSVWKLNLVIKAHAELFDALAEWIEKDNRIIIVKGNHDLEFFWLAVRNQIRLTIGERISRRRNRDLTEVLVNRVFPNLSFVDDTLLVDGRYYIEHGHKYDKYCRCIGGPVLKKDELNVPFGSFFDRYLFNQVEVHYPPFKSIRMKLNVLPLLIEKRFYMGLRALLQHIPVLFMGIPVRYYRYLFGRILLVALVAFYPVLFLIDKFWNIVDPITIRRESKGEPQPFFIRMLKAMKLNILGNFIMSSISFVVSRTGAYMQLEDSSSLTPVAKKKFGENPQIKLITFGHTHHPDMFNENGKQFFNTGTWYLPSGEPEGEKSKQKIFTYLHIFRDSPYKPGVCMLQQWNNLSGCPEPFEFEKNSGSNYLKVVGE